MTILIPFCFAVDDAKPPVLFYKGNMAYEQAKYDEAIVEYQKVLDKGYESGNLYYNLGNAYFKKGQLGKAILNYRRAQRLMPQDVDLRANLEYAQSAVEQSVAPRMSLPMKIAINFVNDISMDALVRFLGALYLLIFLLATGLLFVNSLKRHIKPFLVIISVIFISSAAGLFIKLHQISQPWAVVLDKEAEARYEPFENATAHFKIFQGQEVLVIKPKDLWVFIKRPDGKAGWLKAVSVEKI
jgi:tetratricopeptide (TPR) repeat protein